ncbi:MAG: hypothetical protein H0V27_10800, partial [Pyrinomonadaceae bacterium]|nr:hypothetical protein [Pyrinomonadaceae bacterium]
MPSVRNLKRRTGRSLYLVLLAGLISSVVMPGYTLVRAQSQDYSLTASPSTVAPGGTLNVSWAAPPGRAATDWVGLYRVGTGNGDFLWWQYTGGATSGTFTLSAPSEVGQYEFRYLLDDGYTDVARSQTVTVGSTLPTPT